MLKLKIFPKQTIFLVDDLMERLTAAETSIASLNTTLGGSDSVFGLIYQAAIQIKSRVIEFITSCFENLQRMLL